MKFKFIKDNFRKSRGGTSQFLNIYCVKCSNHILLYQKDGPGALKRMYLDRIIAPDSLSNLKRQEDIPQLVCEKCESIIAVPIIYQKEKRRAYALLAYTIVKKRGKGTYPPEI